MRSGHNGAKIHVPYMVAVLTVNMGTKQRLSLLSVAKDRENPVVGAKNAGRWSR